MTIANSIITANNAFGTIGSGLAVGDTSLGFTTGHGARFPVVAAGQVLYCTLLNSTNVLEIIKITAHSSGSDSATIVRGAAGTSAKAWNAGDRIEARMVTEVLTRLQQEALKGIALTTGDSGITYTGSMSPTALGYITPMVYAMTLTTSNSVTGPTIALDGLSATTVLLDDGSALAISQMPANGLYLYNGTNFILMNTSSAAASAAEIKTGTDASKRLVPSATLAALGFSGYFLSSGQTITPAGQLVIAHGLGREPVLVQVFLKCLTAESGYSIGDKVAVVASISSSGFDNYSHSLVVDATNITVRFGAITYVYAILNKTTGVGVNITPANWQAYFAVWA